MLFFHYTLIIFQFQFGSGSREDGIMKKKKKKIHNSVFNDFFCCPGRRFLGGWKLKDY